jgi:ABC-type thiamine transport system substrate-binding protein
MIDDTSNAAAQQFAVVVSNPQPDVPGTCFIEQDDGEVGEENAPSWWWPRPRSRH